MKTLTFAVLGVAVGIPALILSGLFIHGCNAVTNTAHKAIDVTAAQFDAATMLRKYEWFKEAAAQCDKKVADIKVYERRFQQLKTDYEGKARGQWSREDREQYNIWLSEVSGIQASYNSLAAEYNSAMSKINYAFCNVGQLPRGAETVLVREFKAYTTGN